MDKEAQKIVNLYVISRLSEQQIAERLSVNPSRVRWVLKKRNIQKRSISEAIRLLHITKFNKKEFVLRTHLTSRQQKLKLAGVMLYWGEGAKQGSNVALANSDPTMIFLFIRFLIEICGIDRKRLHAVLHCYPDHNEPVLKEFWSKRLNLPLTQFYPSHVHLKAKGTYKKKSQYGTLSVQYSDKRLLALIKDWIDEHRVL